MVPRDSGIGAAAAYFHEGEFGAVTWPLNLDEPVVVRAPSVGTCAQRVEDDLGLALIG